MKTKEQLFRELPELAAELRRSMANCLSDMVAFAFEGERKHERSYLAEATKLRYRLSAIAELIVLLPSLHYDLVPAEELERISADAADAWWVSEELRRADEEMGEYRRAAYNSASLIPDGQALLRQRETDAAYLSHADAVNLLIASGSDLDRLASEYGVERKGSTPHSYDIDNYEEYVRIPAELIGGKVT